VKTNTNEPAYTPRAEYRCKDSDTHYQGCQCHEQRWMDRIAEAEDTVFKTAQQAMAIQEQLEAVIQERDALRAELQRTCKIRGLGGPNSENGT